MVAKIWRYYEENFVLVKSFIFFFWGPLNVGTVPTFKMLNVGTVPTFKKLNVGTIKNV